MSRYRIIRPDPPVVVVLGATIEELFEHAAYAMFDLGYELDAIPSRYSRPVVAPGDSLPELLVNWLDELRYVSDQEGIIWSAFAVDRLEEGGVQGSAGGMPLAEVVARATAVTRLVTARPEPVPVPDGWWVELEFDTDRRLRPA